MEPTSIPETAREREAFEPTRVQALRALLRGEVLSPRDAAYDDARRIWNAMIDRRPALIARCLDDDDVVRAVRFARVQGLPIAVRGGGHNIAGTALCDDGLVIDLSQMRTVRVDADMQRAVVQAGALLSDVDEATQLVGLATPLGINSTTGVAGLTLGGGFGWLSRRLGMTVDNVVSMDVVLADGQRLHVTETRHPDLFWALRGGGGNFGIVTRFEFVLHPIGPEVLAGLVVYPLAEAAAALRTYRDLEKHLPDELSPWIVMRKAPPLPFLRPEVHGEKVLIVAICHSGSPKQAAHDVEPLRKLGNAYGEHLGMMPYAAWQKAFDPLLGPGARNYWKSHNFSELSNEAIDIALTHVASLPSDDTEVFCGCLGGAVNRVAPDATAYPHRDAKFVMNIHGRWHSAADDTRCVAWARQVFAELSPYATGGAYVNFLTADEAARIPLAYGANYDRLSEVKRRYDPDNVLRANQNVRPAQA